MPFAARARLSQIRPESWNSRECRHALVGAACQHDVMMSTLPDGQTHVPSHPAVPSSMSVRNVLMFAFALFSAAMLGLAAGAVWMVAALYLRQPLPWLVVPIGALLAWAIRSYVRSAGVGAALLAVWATMLAAIYVNMLIAGVLISGNMGMDLIETLRTAGAGMLWQLARMAWSPADIGWTTLAMLLAAWLAWRKPRKHARTVATGK
jgi:hypothetical protein